MSVVKLKPALVAVLAGLQWLSFMFANTVVIPLSIGAAYHLTPAQISGTMSRSFLLTGVACLIQVGIGHGLPLMEGQSGFWWSIVLSLATMGTATGLTLPAIGGSLAVGMILGGTLVAILGGFGLHKILNRLFTPVVMAVLLILLAAQLMDIFLRGMLGLAASGQIQLGVATLSVGIAALVAILTIAGKGLLSNFSILIGLVLGWILYVLLFGSSVRHVNPSFSDITQTFTWGHPAFNLGIIAAAVMTALINTTNTIATLRASEPLFERPVSASQYKRSFIWTGVFTSVSGLFSIVGYAPYTSSIGFLKTTRLLTRTPFVVAASLFIGLGLNPQWSGFFATLPLSIGDSVLFIAYLQLFGSALQNIQDTRFTFRTIYRVALPTLTGLAIQSMPTHAFSSLPGFARTIAGNGLLVGILLAVLLENMIRWEKFEVEKN